MSAKILTIDIETTPNAALVFDLWNQNISLSQLQESTRVLCFAAKWLGERPKFFSEWDDGHEHMIKMAHSMLDEADIVVHYNGKRFDVPHLNREFLLAGLRPPMPYAQVDLFQVVKRNFRFPSNKLAYVTEALELSGKAKHEGFPLWVKAMDGDRKAQREMKRYNVQDTVVTEELYYDLLPWISNHPNLGLWVDEAKPVCPKCGSTQMQKRGFKRLALGIYQQYQCSPCGGWARSGKRISGVDTRSVVL